MCAAFLRGCRRSGWRGALLASAGLGAAAFMAGCGSGSVLAPDELCASWDQLSYRAPGASDTLEISSQGAIRIRGQFDGATGGLIGPHLWPELARAAGSIDDQLPPGAIEPSTGMLCVSSAGEWRGFVWEAGAELAPEQACLIALLDEVRAEAEDPDPQARVDFIAAERLLHGYNADVERGEFVLRDEDALIDFLRETVEFDAVILPAVDFTREMVLAVFLGPRTRATFDVEIDNTVTRVNGGYLQVPITLYTRAEVCPFAGGAGGAYDLVRLPKVDGEVFFLWEQIETGCTSP